MSQLTTLLTILVICSEQSCLKSTLYHANSSFWNVSPHPTSKYLIKLLLCFLGGSNLPSAELQKYFKPLTKLLQYISKYAYVGLCLTSQLDDTVVVAKSMDSEASEGDMNHAYVIY